MFGDYIHTVCSVSPKGWHQLKNDVTIWSHCTNPGIHVHELEDEQYIPPGNGTDFYLRYLTSVQNVDVKNELVYCSGHGYMLDVVNKNEHIPEAMLVHAGILEENFRSYALIGCSEVDCAQHNVVVSLNALEDLYPDFTRCAVSALGLGLTGAEVATYAISGSLKSLVENHLPEL